MNKRPKTENFYRGRSPIPYIIGVLLLLWLVLWLSGCALVQGINNEDGHNIPKTEKIR